VYGHCTRSAAMFVNLRAVQHAGAAESGSAAGLAGGGNRPAARKGSRKILLDARGDFVAAGVYDRDGLAPGDLVDGPAIIEQSDTTTLVEPGWQATVAPNEVLIMRKTA
jgi:N-methylhydantoinase A